MLGTTVMTAASRREEGKAKGKADGRACFLDWESQIRGREMAVRDGRGIAMFGLRRHDLKHRTTKAAVVGPDIHNPRHTKMKNARPVTVARNAQTIVEDAHEVQTRDQDRQSTTTANENHTAPEVQQITEDTTMKSDVRDLPNIVTPTRKQIEKLPTPNTKTRPQTPTQTLYPPSSDPPRPQPLALAAAALQRPTAQQWISASTTHPTIHAPTCPYPILKAKAEEEMESKTTGPLRSKPCAIVPRGA